MRKIIASLLVITLLCLSYNVALAQNLIYETDFSDTSGWYEQMWTSGDTAQVISLDGNEVVLVEANEENDVRFCRDFDVEPNSNYKISCKVKTENVENGSGANISIINSFATSDAVLGTNDWQEISLVGKPAENQNRITVCLRIGGYGATSIGKAWFDDFKIEKLDDVTGMTVADFSEFETSGNDSNTNTGENQDGGVGTVNHPTAQEIYDLLTLFVAMAVILLAVGFACYWFFVRPKTSIDTGREHLADKKFPTPIIGMLIGALLLRLILALSITGYYFDVNCFTFWGIRAAEVPLGQFYDSWCDYPPGYMYVLAAMTGVAKFFGLSSGTAGYMFVIKLPAILCDLGATYLIYALAKKHNLTKAVTYTVTAFVAFSPVMAFISGAWAQIDSVLTMLLIASAILLSDKKLIWAGLVYGIAIVVKPQALMVGPVYALVYLMYIIDAKSGKERIELLVKTLAAVISAVGIIFLLFVPFFPISEGEGFVPYITRLATSIYDKYFSTLGGYDYATIEAYNLFGLVGANWRSSGEIFALGLTYKQFGTIMMAVSVVFSWVLYILGRKKNKYCVFLIMAFLLFSLFIFGHYMHERYLAPVLILVAVAMCGYNDRRLFLAFVAVSAGLLINVLGAFTIILPIVDGNAMRAGWGENYDRFIVIGSIINLIAYAFFAYTTVALTTKGEIKETSEALKPKTKNVKLTGKKYR